MEDSFIITMILSLIIGIGLIVVSIFQYRKSAKEIISFKANAYKIDAEVSGYRTNVDSEHGISYSADYMYNHPTIGPIELMSSRYKIIKPKIGKRKRIYYNPEYPIKYYNNRMEVYHPALPILVVGFMFIGGAIRCIFA